MTPVSTFTTLSSHLEISSYCFITLQSCNSSYFANSRDTPTVWHLNLYIKKTTIFFPAGEFM